MTEAPHERQPAFGEPKFDFSEFREHVRSCIDQAYVDSRGSDELWLSNGMPFFHNTMVCDGIVGALEDVKWEPEMVTHILREVSHVLHNYFKTRPKLLPFVMQELYAGIIIKLAGRARRSAVALEETEKLRRELREQIYGVGE